MTGSHEVSGSIPLISTKKRTDAFASVLFFSVECGCSRRFELSHFTVGAADLAQQGCRKAAKCEESRRRLCRRSIPLISTKETAVASAAAVFLRDRLARY